MKEILVIVYKFPPMGGIGTRRWAKFSKYLAKKGYVVHILTAEYPYKDDVNWEEDIKSKNIIVHYFKSKYPSYLLNSSSNKYINKVKRLTQFLLYKTFFYIDIAQYDSKRILSKAKEIIANNNITNVVSSGHPVSINYISTYLKIDYPNINLIQDYRDNWNDLNVYQFASKGGLKTFKQKEKIAYQEFFTLNYSDLIINVSEDLTNSLRNKHKYISDKLITITNGYDNDDFNKFTLDEKSDEFSIIYAGSLFNHRIEAINLLLDAILELNDTFINKYFKIIIYSNFDSSRLDSKYKKLINKNIFFNAPVSPSNILDIIARKNYCLSVNSKFASYAFGTKIFDYMALNKKILHISNGGILSEILIKKKQFVCDYDLENMKNILITLKDDFLKKDRSLDVDYTDYSIEKLTLKLEKYFV